MKSEEEGHTSRYNVVEEESILIKNKLTLGNNVWGKASVIKINAV